MNLNSRRVSASHYTIKICILANFGCFIHAIRGASVVHTTSCKLEDFQQNFAQNSRIRLLFPYVAYVATDKKSRLMWNDRHCSILVIHTTLSLLLKVYTFDLYNGKSKTASERSWKPKSSLCHKSKARYPCPIGFLLAFLAYPWVSRS